MTRNNFIASNPNKIHDEFLKFESQCIIYIRIEYSKTYKRHRSDRKMRISEKAEVASFAKSCRRRSEKINNKPKDVKSQ